METEIKDPGLWKVAKKRAGFKYRLIIYLAVTIFLWILWYVNTAAGQGFFPWPLWPMCGFGIGIFYTYINAYRSNNKLAEKKYLKLTYKQ